MQSVVDLIRTEIESVLDTAVERVQAAGSSVYSSFPVPMLRAAIKRAYEAVLQDLEADTTAAFPGYLRSIAAQRAQQGSQVREVLQGFNIGMDVATERIAAQLDLDALLWWWRRRNELSFEGGAAFSEALLTAREQIIEHQLAQLQALSTPIVPIYSGVLVLPLIGSLDARRASEMTEALLEAITSYQADQVIIDITGVPVVDTDVAQYLLQATRATRLLGSQVILVGIGAYIAQTIVQLGLDLTDIVTRANLQAGIEYALAAQRLHITAIRDDEPGSGDAR